MTRRPLATATKPATTRLAATRCGGDKVGGDKVMGDKLIIQPATMFQPLHQLRAPRSAILWAASARSASLREALGKAAAGGAVAAISGGRGMGGIGKTELAYSVARS